MPDDGGMSDSVMHIFYNAKEFDLIHHMASQTGFDFM